jgi:small-conductance mechanosensitive channel
MPASDFQKRSLFFLLFAGTAALLLVLMPAAESFVQEYLAGHYGIVLAPDGSITAGGDMMTQTSVSIAVTLFHVFKILVWLALIIAIVRYVGYLLFATVFRGAGQSEISSLVRTVLSIVIYIVSFFIIFQSQFPTVQLAPLFTGSTIIGIVVGLALQDTLGNLFAGIALQADQPFQVGDVISISNRGTGVVETVSWRGVKIRTFQNKLLVISNAVLGKETIEVAPKDNLNARVVTFSTDYLESPDRVTKAVRDAVRQTENVTQKLRPVVRIRNLGDNGVEWEVKYWAEDYTKHNDTDALVRQRIWYVMNRERIDFAHPNQTIHLRREPHKRTHVEYLSKASRHLQDVPIFAPLCEDELHQLAEASNLRVFAPGEPIVRRGQEGRSMYVITRGAVRVQIPVNGSVRTINQLKANDFFGEMSLLTGEPRTATVVAEEETEVLQIKKGALKPLFEQNPDLMKAICEIVEERRELLDPQDFSEEPNGITAERGVLASIRKFFGMG